MRIGKQLLDLDFYSRPCGRGDPARSVGVYRPAGISTHAPAGGATSAALQASLQASAHFYSRPCGRGDKSQLVELEKQHKFLLTPLREGRPSLSASFVFLAGLFLLTPLREGRPATTAGIPAAL